MDHNAGNYNYFSSLAGHVTFKFSFLVGFITNLPKHIQLAFSIISLHKITSSRDNHLFVSCFITFINALKTKHGSAYVIICNLFLSKYNL